MREGMKAKTKNEEKLPPENAPCYNGPHTSFQL
jgi:hypothetical protein